MQTRSGRKERLKGGTRHGESSSRHLGTRGVGAAICKALKKAGYNVAANYGGNDEAAQAFKKETKIPVFKWDVGDYVARNFNSKKRDTWNVPPRTLCGPWLEGAREGIGAARWLREVCDIPIVFVTGNADPDTVERIHQQAPGAPVLPKLVYRDPLADAGRRSSNDCSAQSPSPGLAEKYLSNFPVSSQ